VLLRSWSGGHSVGAGRFGEWLARWADGRMGVVAAFAGRCARAGRTVGPLARELSERDSPIFADTRIGTVPGKRWLVYVPAVVANHALRRHGTGGGDEDFLVHGLLGWGGGAGCDRSAVKESGWAESPAVSLRSTAG
jgi:hypothetical protein